MSTRPAPTAGRALRVLPPARPGPWGSSALSAVAAIPWCCLAPAALASLGLASSMLASRLGAGLPLFLLASAGFLGRAHYLTWVKGHGSCKARIATLLLTAVVVWTWSLRLAPWLAGGTP